MLVATAAGLIFFWFLPRPKPLEVSASAAEIKYWKALNEPMKEMSATELKSDVRVKALCDRASQILAKVKQICDDFHLQFVGPMKFSPTEGSISEMRSTLRSPDAFFYFSLPTQQLEIWENFALGHHLDSSTNPSSYKSPIEQQWSQDKAMQIGTAFLHAFLNGADVKLDQGNAQFVSNELEYHTNTWFFRWTRLDSHGYRFFNNVFTVQVPQGYGPVRVNFPKITPYVEEKGTMMSRGWAFAIASRVKSASPFRDWSISNSSETAPVIVGDHLMWEFSVYTSRGNYAESASIFIDAYTGEYELYAPI